MYSFVGWNGWLEPPQKSAQQTRTARLRARLQAFSARRVKERAGKRGVLWQRGYYEHVIRNEKALDRIRAYIANNPARWADDPEVIR